MARATWAFCASTAAKRENNGRPNLANLRQRPMLRGDILALTSTSGICRSAVPRTRFGQISDSVKIESAGFQ